MKTHGVSWLNDLIHPVSKKRLIPQSWNVVTGCTPEFQCWDRCWARELSVKRMAHLGEHYRHFIPHFHQDRLRQPLHWRDPRAIWVAGMGDLFHEQITDEQIMRILEVITTCQQHLFIVLTKRLMRAADVMTWFRFDSTVSVPENFWLLASVEDQQTVDERIPQLLQVPAALHGVSLEPMIDSVYFHPGWLSPCSIEWIICGGENHARARPCDPAWVREVRDQCVVAGVPFHFKGWGTNNDRLGRELDDEIWDEMPMPHKQISSQERQNAS